MRQYALNYLHTVQSYGSGKPPKEWKTTIVSPIHKKDNKSSTKNYQPISLTCIKPSSSSTVEIDKNTFFWLVFDQVSVSWVPAYADFSVLSSSNRRFQRNRGFYNAANSTKTKNNMA